MAPLSLSGLTLFTHSPLLNDQRYSRMGIEKGVKCILLKVTYELQPQGITFQQNNIPAIEVCRQMIADQALLRWRLEHWWLFEGTPPTAG